MDVIKVISLGTELYKLGKEVLQGTGTVSGAKSEIRDHRARLLAQREENDRKIAEAEARRGQP